MMQHKRWCNRNPFSSKKIDFYFPISFLLIRKEHGSRHVSTLTLINGYTPYSLWDNPSAWYTSFLSTVRTAGTAARTQRPTNKNDRAYRLFYHPFQQVTELDHKLLLVSKARFGLYASTSRCCLICSMSSIYSTNGTISVSFFSSRMYASLDASGFLGGIGSNYQNRMNVSSLFLVQLLSETLGVRLN